MEGIKPIKLKICLVGEHAVGKTCLIRKYTFDEFSDRYISTIGAKITKNQMTIQNPKTKKLVDVQLMIWDIIGQKGFRQLLQEAYFFGAQGIIGVCDNTKEDTLSDLRNWIDVAHNITGEIPIVFLGNKCDLEDDQEMGLSEIINAASEYERSVPYLSSAKTGFNVRLAFKTLSEIILEDVV